MMKLKWFIGGSLVLSLVTALILYQYYRVMDKVLTQLEYVNMSSEYTIEDAKRSVWQSIRQIERYEYAVRTDMFKQRRNTMRDLAEKSAQMMSFITHGQEELYQAISNDGQSVFSVRANNRKLITYGLAEQLYERYQTYIEDLSKAYTTEYNTLTFSIPNKKEFIESFENVPIAVSQTILTNWKFQVAMDCQEAIGFLTPMICFNFPMQCPNQCTELKVVKQNYPSLWSE